MSRRFRPHHVITQKFEQISAELTQPTYWVDFDLALDDETQHKLLTKLETTIKQTAQPPEIDPDEIMLRVSDQDRQTLRLWIDRAADEIPRRFCQTIHRLNTLEDELKHVSHEIELVPADETLQPLVETLHQYSRKLGKLEKTDTDLSEQVESLTYQITQVGYQLERVRQQLDDQQQHDQRIHLAIESQKVLGEYLKRLRHEKVKLLEKALGRRFNQLCRKEDLISGVIIDPG